MKNFDFKYPFYTIHGPMAVVRVCGICGHNEKVIKGRRGVGRGYGMREGNRARGRMIKHLYEHKSLSGRYDIFTIKGKRRKVGEVDICGWTMREVLAMLRAVRLNDRTAKYYGL